jgi:hypothetical protein
VLLAAQTDHPRNPTTFAQVAARAVICCGVCPGATFTLLIPSLAFVRRPREVALLCCFNDPTSGLPIPAVTGKQPCPPPWSSSHYQNREVRADGFFYWPAPHVRLPGNPRSSILCHLHPTTGPPHLRLTIALRFATMAGLFRRIYDWLLRLFW